MTTRQLLAAVLVVATIGACAGSDDADDTTAADTASTDPAPNAPSSTGPVPTGTVDLRRDLAGGGAVSNITIDSPSLGQEQAIKVYESPGLGGAGAVPVVYLLHGQQEGEQMWQSLGVFDAADRLVSAGEIGPLLIVTPNIDNSFGVNNPESELFDIPDGPTVFYDGNRYEDFLAEDLVAYVDAAYPTIDDRSGRYVGGISMGGFAALHLAFRHTDLFSRVGGHSPALVSDPEFTWLYPDDSAAASRDPMRLAETADLRDVEVRLDVGEQDGWGFEPPTTALAGILDERGVAVELDVAPGHHDAAYWASNLEEYLLFYVNGIP